MAKARKSNIKYANKEVVNYLCVLLLRQKVSLNIVFYDILKYL